MGAFSRYFESGPSNPNWKGGRSVASNGYILVRVGVGHHLADCRGYAYEHRLVGEQKIGRRLLPGEEVHHDDENPANNHPDNLIVADNRAIHRLLHRKPGSKLRVPGEPNPEIECLCGCRNTFPRYDRMGRPRDYLSGHNPHPSPTVNLVMKAFDKKPSMLLREIVSETGLKVSSVKMALTKLRSRGSVLHSKEYCGEWMIGMKPDEING